MTGSGRPSPEPLLKKAAPPAVLGGDNSGNALEASNALNYRVWGIPAVLSTGIPGNALRAFPGSFPEFLLESASRTGGVAQIWVFLNQLFGEPVVCTPDSRGFRHFGVFPWFP